MKLATKLAGVVSGGVLLAAGIVMPVAAHVVVQPGVVLTGAFQTFTVGAPNEQDQPFTTIKLDIPDGLQYVAPTNKPGWNITMDKTGEGETATVKSITWDGGSVPGGFRDEFTFSAKAPAAATQLNWKAYQTYADGTTVSWDQKPQASEADDDSASRGPYSITSVVAETEAEQNFNKLVVQTDSAKKDAQFALYSAVAALLVTLGLFVYVLRKGSSDSSKTVDKN